MRRKRDFNKRSLDLNMKEKAKKLLKKRENNGTKRRNRCYRRYRCYWSYWFYW